MTTFSVSLVSDVGWGEMLGRADASSSGKERCDERMVLHPPLLLLEIVVPLSVVRQFIDRLRNRTDESRAKR